MPLFLYFMKQLIQNIKLLVNAGPAPSVKRGAELAQLSCLEDAFLLVEDQQIAAFGGMAAMPASLRKIASTAPTAGVELTDARGCLVLPAWCDSHTHLVFAATREAEFVDKLKGMSYAEIAARGGGILNSAERLQATDEEELYRLAKKKTGRDQHTGYRGGRNKKRLWLNRSSRVENAARYPEVTTAIESDHPSQFPWRP